MSLLFNPQDQQSAMESRTRPSEQWSPAPYGKACIGCARAKCKCFYHPNGTGCERCLRLGKHCEPSVAVRRRKARRQSPPQPSAATAGTTQQPQQQLSLESKLDEVVSLLKAQSTSVQSHPTASTSSSAPHEHSSGASPSNNSTLVNSASHDSPEVAQDFCSGPRGPNIMIDCDNSVFHLVRPDKFSTYPQLHDSPILKDISTHALSERQSEELLGIFRKDFLTVFPFVRIDNDLKAADLRLQKPFLWLIIMSIANRNVAEQFAMEETIWKVISQRIVIQHHVSLDLLQGLVCFASWSHYFKQDKPFMVTLVQLAVGMAYDSDLHKDSQTKTLRTKPKYLTDNVPVEKAMTLEQRRTFVSVFHLSSACWSSYRKTEPIRLTPYIEDCIKILNDSTDCELDPLLAFQARCHIINNQLTCPASGASDNQPLGAPSKMLQTAMLRQLEETRRALPKELQETSSVQFYVHSTELTIRDQFLGTVKSTGPSSLGQFQRLEELELTLICIERWLDTWRSIPLESWVGINVDNFAQFTHCLAVLYRLTTLEDPDWDNEDVKRRADILSLLDHYAETLGEVHKITGMVDAPGPRSGMFFKTSFLLKAIKKLFAKALDPEYEEQEPARPEKQPVDELKGNIQMAPDVSMEEPSFTQEFLSGLAEEPWISDVFGTTWDFAMDLDVDWQQQQYV